MIFDTVKKVNNLYICIKKPKKKIGINEVESIKIHKYNGKRLYYKPIAKGGTSIQDNSILPQQQVLSEIINSKVYRRLGLESPPYYVAIDDITHGVISEDVQEIHPHAQSITSLAEKKEIKFETDSLNELKTNKFFQSAFTDIFELLDTIMLTQVATGNFDGHYGNILVHPDKGKTRYTGVTMIDSSQSYPAKVPQLDKLKELYDTPYILYHASGIEHSNQQTRRFLLSNIYSDISTSPYISDKAIIRHLTNVNNLLTSNSMYEIRNEVVEECRTMGKMVTIIDNFMEREQFVLEKTTSDIEKTFEQREK